MNKTLYLCCLTALLFPPSAAVAQEKIADGKPAASGKRETNKGEAKPHKVELDRGKYVVLAPAKWSPRKVASRILTHEFAYPADAKKGDPQVRITFSQIGGGAEANIARWQSQFATKTKDKVEELKIEKAKVHLVDIEGTYKDSMGRPPFAGLPPELREDYRMLGAVIEPDLYIKMTGPTKMVAKLADGMKKMLKEMKVK